MGGSGNGSGPAFVYLHGFASGPASTKARAFARWGDERGIDVQALDLRVPSFESLRFSAIVARVRAAIDASGGAAARAALVGSSLGGLAACRAAESDPRVCALFLLAPAFRLAASWKERLGDEGWNRWRTEGSLQVEDHAPTVSGTAEARALRVDFGFIEELERIDGTRNGVEHYRWPDVRVPTFIVHGRRDDVVSIEVSRTFARTRRHVHLLEVDDGHDLAASIPTILAEADRFFEPFGVRYSMR